MSKEKNKNTIANANSTKKLLDTREQLLAQTFDRHLSVTANAGSGKTRVLVNRYLNLVLNDVNPKYITAITFTRKAAGEMLLKVAKNFEEMILRERSDKELERFKTIREQLTNAKISTIHSFCKGLLRDYPIEADVSPNAIELSSTELYRIKQFAITTVLEAKIESKNTSESEKVKRLFSIIGSRKLPELIMKILDKREIIDQLDNIYSSGFENYIEKRNIYIKESLIPSIKKVIEGTRETLFNSIEEQKLKSSNKKHYTSAVISFQECEKLYKEYNKSFEVPVFEQLLMSFIELQSSFMLSNNKDCRFYKELKDIEIGYNPNMLSDLFRLIVDCAKSYKNDVYEKNHFETAADLYSIVKEIIEYIDKEKELLGGLDFDDMLIKTEKLLRIPEVRNKIRRRIKYLLVDEFQDTNSLQYKIIKNISGCFETDEFFSKDVNLFIVGDGKQSIYGFRNADVRVFEEATNDLKSINQKLMQTNTIGKAFTIPPKFTKEQSERMKQDSNVTLPEEILGEIRLSASFRLKSIPATFINKICRQIMNRDCEFDVEYDNLVCARDVDCFFDNDKSNFDCNQEKSQGSVSMIVAQDFSKANDDESDLLTEEELIARYIIKFRNENKEYDFKSFTVLSRTSDFRQLANTLLNYQIPFVRHSGTGFFMSQEIKDFTSFLKFLHNPSDNLALAAILRSPFFNLGDSLIFSLSLHKTGTSFWEKLLDIVDNQNHRTLNFNLERACRILKRCLSLASRLTISRIITEILESTSYIGFVATSPRKAQIKANIEKLKILGRNFEQRGFKNLYDFVEEIRLMENSQSKESEAAIITDVNAVNLMTIHSAKGLEFPVTILYNIGKQTKVNTDSFNISPELGITFSYNAGKDAGDYDSFVAVPSYAIAKSRAKLAENAEEKRVFYVAMTRAQDHLVLSSKVKYKKDNEASSPSGFLKMLSYALGWMPSSDNENIAFHFKETIDILRENENKYVNIEYDFNIIKNIERQEMGSQAVKEGTKPIILRNAIPLSMKNEFYSPTRLALYENYPKTYLEKYILGFTDEFISDDNSSDFYDGGSDKIGNFEIGAQIGNIIHAVLEKYNLWLVNQKIDDDKLENFIKNEVFSAYRGLDKDRIFKRAIAEVKNVFSTGLINNYINKFDAAKPEMMLSMPLGDDFIHGKIDLLISDSKGFFEIWDWKTNLVDSKEKFDELAEYYKPQLHFYAFLIMHLHPDYKEYKARLLFTRLANPDAKDEDWTKIFIWRKEELLEYKKELEKKITEIEALSFLPVLDL